jgi:2-amino-4-hydroxy-6-hydroxymethyldihydropteridine diphosphokinase
VGSVRAYVGLGSNVGDREEHLRRAVELLERREGVTVVSVSAIIENPPVGGPPGQGPFLNGVAALDTTLSPRELLRACQDIEDSLGRTREVRWGPRTMDIDILLYGDQVVGEPDLEIPHPRMHERDFVLIPLAVLAPEARHPVLGRTARELYETLLSARHESLHRAATNPGDS